MNPFYIIGVVMLSGSILLPHERTARAVAIVGAASLMLGVILALA